VSVRISSAWLVLVLGALTASCNNSSSAPTPLLAFVAGPAPTIYAGSIADSVEGNGTLKVALNSAAGLVAGTWDMSFAGKADPTYTISGPEGTAYSATVTTCKDNGFGLNCNSKCAFHFSGSLTTTSLNGTYSAISDQSCLGRTGTINTTKQ
jgi:hypothetical protein